MKFEEITEETKVHPGEYLLYTPTRQIVLCGAFLRSQNKIKAMAQGRLIEDTIQNFHKIRVNKNTTRPRRGCSGCKGS